MNNKIFEIFSKLTKRSDARLTAKSAYLKSKYQRIQTDEERVKDFKEIIESLIAAKCEVGHYCCVIQLENDLAKFLDEIVSEFTEIGYTVVNLKEKIEEVENIYLFFCWDKKY